MPEELYLPCPYCHNTIEVENLQDFDAVICDHCGKLMELVHDKLVGADEEE